MKLKFPGFLSGQICLLGLEDSPEAVSHRFLKLSPLDKISITTREGLALLCFCAFRLLLTCPGGGRGYMYPSLFFSFQVVVLVSTTNTIVFLAAFYRTAGNPRYTLVCTIHQEGAKSGSPQLRTLSRVRSKGGIDWIDKIVVFPDPR